MEAAQARPRRTGARKFPTVRAFWLFHLHRWHWISAALSLIGMLLFAITGVTLNHAAMIEARPKVASQEATLPAELRHQLTAQGGEKKQPLPADVSQWIAKTVGANVAGREAEWSDREIYVALPRPGGDAWLSIARNEGAITYEVTSRGWISYFNDLHKGRHTGLAWTLFLDIFALGCVVFCVTGLFLLQMHGRTRPMTWPTVALGFVIPLLLVIVFIHL
nr:PepSY-associated TM helix domain-containing protein [Variibacter gotjawalensis]